MAVTSLAQANRAAAARLGTGEDSLPPEIRQAIARIARTPRLLVACDYDGTLAPIVPDPKQAVPVPESVGALRSLSVMADTTAAVISSRALRDLATLSRLPAEVHLVGSHGTEFDIGFVHALDDKTRGLHDRLRTTLHACTSGIDGVLLEIKPASVAVHVRSADQHDAAQVVESIRSGPARWRGIQVSEGEAVIELSVVPTDKGKALETLRHQVGASATLYLGDSATDEKAFGRLIGPDLGIKVGKGPTVAEFRIVDARQVAIVLALLVEHRRAWLYGESATPIERLSMLANGSAVALVTPEAKLTWLCHPEPDAAAVFADLLGGPGAGHFTVGPARGSLPLGQRYLPGTMTVETRWSRLLVTDYLEHGTPAHRTDLTRVISGSSSVVLSFAPRPEFGQVGVRLIAEGDGLRVTGTGDPMVLRSPGVTWHIGTDGTNDTAESTVDLVEGEPLVLELRCGTDDLAPHPIPELERRETARRYWSDWLATVPLPSVEPELVARSALTLRALCHARTGGIMAAATTSLPEVLGGVRNWDYRYCWLRDGAMTAHALVMLGSAAEAEGFLRWLHGVLATIPGPQRLHPLYTLAGTALGPEAVIDTLPGYAGSRPVRVGNAANQQVQLDVFGPVVELIVALSELRGTLSDDDWLLVTAMAEAVEARWTEPDHGLWEETRALRHHVYSKVMCWVTIDRALRLATTYRREPASTWVRLRRLIAKDVLDNGWDSAACGGIGAFTTAYDGLDLDAASLHVGLSGLLDPADPRFQATVTAVESELRVGPAVYRYRRADGLPGSEGGFHLCATWLVEAYLQCGRRSEALELFEQIIDTAGPTGLLPEEYDPVAERSLGNHPQAYSHLGVIRCAQLLAGEVNANAPTAATPGERPGDRSQPPPIVA